MPHRRRQATHSRAFVLTAHLLAAAAAGVRRASAAAPDAGSAAAGGGLSARRMTAAAVTLLEALAEAQRAAVLFPPDADERAGWSNLPAALVPRAGVRVGDLDEGARRRLHAGSPSSPPRPPPT